MVSRLWRPALGVFLAIAVTTWMDASGLAVFSALPLLPLLVVFWYLERLPRSEVGFGWGRPSHYLLAIAYPVIVLGAAALIAAAAGAVDVSQTDWPRVQRNLVLTAASSVLVTILTEEGFFRGWLWASLRRAGLNEARTLLWSSLWFSLWHVSAVSLETGFDLPAGQIPVYLLNAAVMGAVWGLLRSISGSVIVASLSHGVWNGIAYVMFGYSTKVGALGIVETPLYGPEVGFVGLVLNVAFAAALGLWWKARGRDHA